MHDINEIYRQRASQRFLKNRNDPGLLGMICNTLWEDSRNKQKGIPYTRKEWMKGAPLSTLWKQYTLVKNGGLAVVHNGEYEVAKHRFLIDILTDSMPKEQIQQNVNLCIELRKVGI